MPSTTRPPLRFLISITIENNTLRAVVTLVASAWVVPHCLVMLCPATYAERGSPGGIYRECPVGKLQAVLGVANQARQRLACSYPLGIHSPGRIQVRRPSSKHLGQIPDMFRGRTQF